MACGICRCSGLWLNAGRICSILSFYVLYYSFHLKKSLPYLLCILGAGHFLIYFAVKMSNMMRNASKTSVVTQENAQNQTEPEG